MQSHSPIDSIKSNHPTMERDVEKKIIKALKILEKKKGFLATFSEENLESLYKIEMINHAYFPGLSNAAAETILNLYNANPKLSISLLLEITYDLAGRGRPWESLSAFSRIATSCPQQINEEMLSHLLKVDSTILEICSHEIANETQKSKKGVSGVIGALSSFLSGAAKEVDIKATIEAYMQRGYRYS